MHLMVSYTINSLFYVYLKTQGLPTSNHPVLEELEEKVPNPYFLPKAAQTNRRFLRLVRRRMLARFFRPGRVALARRRRRVWGSPCLRRDPPARGSVPTRQSPRAVSVSPLPHLRFRPPSDVVKTRLQVSGGSIGNVVGSAMKTEGPLAFYKGINAAWLREAPEHEWARTVEDSMHYGRRSSAEERRTMSEELVLSTARAMVEFQDSSGDGAISASELQASLRRWLDSLKRYVKEYRKLRSVEGGD